MQKIPFIVILVFSLNFYSCEKQIPDQVIPFTIVSEDILLTNLQYINLSNIGGFVYFNQAGYRGLIIYHEGNGVYRVFERACSYDPRSDCSPVEVDESTLYMKHTCCSSTFDFNGNPTGGPASVELLQYSAYLDGNYLKIRNEN